MVGFGEAIKRAFAEYRLRRAGYPGRVLVVCLFVWLVTFIPYILICCLHGLASGEDARRGILAVARLLDRWSSSLAVIAAVVAVSVRRLHDTDRSGWWYWIVLVPCGIGGIWYLVLMLLAEHPGPEPVRLSAQYSCSRTGRFVS